MKSSEHQKILMLLIYMVLGSAASVFITILSMSLLVDIYLYMTEEINFDLYVYDFVKILKVSFFCGFIGGGGCWTLYYRNYRKNR
ncbi:hypothetical protein ACQE32_07215 [Pantoea sp. FN0302]|uniref:hypothetical protein n=1 Tax=Pantoea sp. FN0302 TaxID=3418558 RepID=UPI003CEBC206